MNLWGIYFVLLHKVNLVLDLDIDLLFFSVVLMILGGESMVSVQLNFF
jgi:hypothetical protein